jgi:hypothetical protein
MSIDHDVALYRKMTSAQLREYFKVKRAETRKDGTRIWFESGTSSFIQSGNTCFMDMVQVVMRNVGQKIVDQDPNSVIQSKVDDPELRKTKFWIKTWDTYACAVTNQMQEIVGTGYPFANLNDTYRFFALIRSLIGAKGKLKRKEFLVKGYETEKIQVPAQFNDGLKNYKYSIKLADGVTYSHSTWACGGVLLSGETTRKLVDNGDVRLAGRMALDSMRSCTASCWDVH